MVSWFITAIVTTTTTITTTPNLEEGVGFEPTDRLYDGQKFSKFPVSATHPTFRILGVTGGN